MRKISAGEAGRMSNTAIESLNDICTVYSYVGATDSDTGEILDTYDSNVLSGIACGLAVGHEQLNERGEIITIDADAVLRTDQNIKVKDKIVVTNKTYIVDGVTNGRTIYIAALKEIKF